MSRRGLSSTNQRLSHQSVAVLLIVSLNPSLSVVGADLGLKTQGTVALTAFLAPDMSMTGLASRRGRAGRPRKWCLLSDLSNNQGSTPEDAVDELFCDTSQFKRIKQEKWLVKEWLQAQVLSPWVHVTALT